MHWLCTCLQLGVCACKGACITKSTPHCPPPLPYSPIHPVAFCLFTALTAKSLDRSIFRACAGQLRRLTTHVSHVLPVSDDGGSTAEIVRVIGGPAVGDIRSRCLRLADDRDEEVRGERRGGRGVMGRWQWQYEGSCMGVNFAAGTSAWQMPGTRR